MKSLYQRRSRQRSTAKRLSTAVPTVIDPLEGRQLLAASIGPDGWTDITPSADTRVVYVSASTGSDSNNGLSPDSPLKTIAKGKSLLRNNRPDWLLLKRGDVFNERYGLLNLSGRSEQEPLLISAYGTGDRPILLSRTDNAINTNITAVNHVAIVGLHFNSNTNDPSSPDFINQSGGYGFYGVAPVSDLLIEDCVFAHYGTNLLFQNTQGPVSDVAVRRSVIVDATGGARPQGSYVNGVNGILFEENLFDHNGWSEEVSNRPATIFNHNIYMSSRNTGVVVRGNIFSNASSHGIQARSGGIVEDNLFLENPISLLFGNGSSFTAGGVSGRVAGNVILGGRDINGAPRGYAFEIGNTRPGGGTVVENNIMAHDTERNFPAIRLSMGSAPENLSDAVGLNDVTIRQNIVYDWWYAMGTDDDYVPGGAGFKALNGLEIYDNDFQQMISPQLVKHDHEYESDVEAWDRNNYWDESPSSAWFRMQMELASFDQWQESREGGASRTQKKYLDPNRTIGSYSQSVGGEATLQDFIDEVRLQGRHNWRPQFTARAVIDYVREGFQVDAEAPSAGLEAADVTEEGGRAHTFVVHYADDTGIDPRTLDDADVRVTGPDGFDETATLLGVDRAGTAARAAIYSFTAPGGRWDEADAGLYTVSVQTNQVADTRGNFVRGGTVGQFWFRTDDAPPTAASYSASNISVAGGTGHQFTVTYLDDSGLDVDSLGSGDIRVTGPDGYEQLARMVSVDKAGDGSPRVVTYSITAPGGTWDAADRGAYTVTLRDDQVRDNDDNYIAGGRLGGFTVDIGALPPPSVQVAAFDLSAAGGAEHTFKVYYRGRPAAVAAAVEQEWEVTGPAGFNKPAKLKNVAVLANGVVRVVTYAVAAPDGAWDSTDNGTYSIRRYPGLDDGITVADAGDLAVAAAADTFSVAVPSPDLTAPTIVAASFSATFADVVTLQFSESVAQSLSLQDFDVSVIGSGGESFEVSVMALVYDRTNNKAYLAFRGFPRGELSEGSHRLVVNAFGVTDAAKNKLNGGRPFMFYFKKK